MAYPPALPVNNRVNATPQANNHPADHNTLVNALTDILNELGSDPSSGSFATVMARLDALDPRANPSTLPLFQWGLFNGQTDSNAFARVNWPIAYPAVPASGDLGNRDDSGVVCMAARGPGAIVTTNGATFALGAFNAKDALIKVWGLNGVPVVSGYAVFHYLVWGPRYAGAYNFGTDNQGLA